MVQSQQLPLQRSLQRSLQESWAEQFDLVDSGPWAISRPARSFSQNSGIDSNEGALKFARKVARLTVKDFGQNGVNNFGVISFCEWVPWSVHGGLVS